MHVPYTNNNFMLVPVWETQLRPLRVPKAFLRFLVAVLASNSPNVLPEKIASSIDYYKLN